MAIQITKSNETSHQVQIPCTHITTEDVTTTEVQVLQGCMFCIRCIYMKQAATKFTELEISSYNCMYTIINAES